MAPSGQNPSGTTPRPIFLFALPRSGSTLLQRMLACHPRIATAAEPWILLPLVEMTDPAGLRAYDHATAVRAIRAFVDSGQSGSRALDAAIRQFATELYRDHCPPGSDRFLDKTPRYWRIADRIAEIFPDASLIFLFRDPLQILSSVIETWCHGGLARTAIYRSDLERGVGALADASRRLADRSLSLRYDELVADPSSVMTRVWSHLGVEACPEAVEDFSAHSFAGQMGDQTGDRVYGQVSSGSLDKWRHVLRGSVRRRFVASLADQWSDADLAPIGLDRATLRSRIRELGSRHPGAELADLVGWWLARRIRRDWWHLRLAPEWRKVRRQFLA